MKHRGFNQSEDLANNLSASFKIPVLRNALIKVKNTAPQAELDKEERGKNIINAFACDNSEVVKGKKILLVDDVYTTGSTMEECSRVLKENGAKSIWGIVVARG